MGGTLSFQNGERVARAEEDARVAREETRALRERAEEDARVAREETRALRVARERAEEDARVARRVARREQLKAAKPTHIPSLSTDAAVLSTKPLDNLELYAALDRVLVGFDKSAVEDDIVADVIAGMEGVVVPAALAAEIAGVHPFVNTVLLKIECAAKARGHRVLKRFYESTTTALDDRNRPDFSFTRANEQCRVNANTCTYLEVKARQRSGKSRAALMREGVAQCIRYLAERQERCDDLPTCGVACATTGGLQVVAVRIDFSDDDMPVALSNELCVLPAATGVGGASDAPLPPPDGLRALVRLLLTSSVKPFGLAPVTFALAEDAGYEWCGLLGEGGFATVAAVSCGGASLACKYVRHDSEKGEAQALHNERSVLLALEAAGVPHVPRVVVDAGDRGIIRSIDGKEGLLMAPVGTALPSLAAALPEDEDGAPVGAMGAGRGGGEHAAFAAAALCQVWSALLAAHAAGYVHMDVRPSNIVRMPGSDHGVVLIDWGLAECIALSRPRKAMVGERAFVGNRRLRIMQRREQWRPEPEDDLQAAVLTACALAATGSVHAPWPDDPMLMTCAGVEAERAEWIRGADALLRAVAELVDVPAARAALLALLDESRALAA